MSALSGAGGTIALRAYASLTTYSSSNTTLANAYTVTFATGLTGSWCAGLAGTTASLNLTGNNTYTGGTAVLLARCGERQRRRPSR